MSHQNLRNKIILIIINLLSFLPLYCLQAFGVILGNLFFYIPNRERRVCAINIKLCFPNMTDFEQSKLVQKNLVENMKVLLETIKLTRMPPEEAIKLVKFVHNKDVIEKAMAENKGLIVIGPHLGNWELGLHVVKQFGKITAMYAPPKQAFLDELIHSTREKTGAKLVPTNISGIRSLLTSLKNGEMIGILPDQKPKNDQSSTLAPFFEHQVSTMLLVNSMAVRTSAKAVFSYTKRLGLGQGFEHYFVAAPDGFDSSDVNIAAAALNLGVEICVRQNPSQYQWTYKRFDISNYD